MNNSQLTDERLKYLLNTNQKAQENMCAAILGIEDNYTDIEPQRPQGGPDGGRDILCRYKGNLCVAAVGFKNPATDEKHQVREITCKYEADLDVAIQKEGKLKSFVFFTNIDLSPAERHAMEAYAKGKQIESIEIYWRDRINLLLNSPEGYAVRYQFLDIPLDDSEQKVFFNKYSKEIHKVITGQISCIEKQISQLSFDLWRRSQLREICLHVQFNGYVDSRHLSREEFYVGLELQPVGRKGYFVIGAKSNYKKRENQSYDFDYGTFFWDEKRSDIKKSLLSNGRGVTGGIINSIIAAVSFSPHSNIFVEELNGLVPSFYFSSILKDRIYSVSFRIDNYIFFEWVINENRTERCVPHHDWPGLTEETKKKHEWLEFSPPVYWLRFDSPPQCK